jgi:hypothetical protein
MELIVWSEMSVTDCQFELVTSQKRKITLGEGSRRVIRFSPVSIIPPTLHIHSSFYHRRWIVFFSQYFSFPCQYHSTNGPYSFIHPPSFIRSPTLYIFFLPALRFPLSVSFHNCSILIRDWLYIILAVDLLNNTLWKKLSKYLRDCIKIPPNSVVK